MKDTSIEYAHIYTNSEIKKEHHTALQELRIVKEQQDINNNSYSLIILVDDYSFPDPTFEYDEFINWLDKSGFKPDFIYRESQLIPLCDEVLKLINDNKLKKKLVNYIKNKKYPCSLFIAAWYLLRLGLLKHPAFDENIVAKQLINILPESFKPYEDDCLKIISATKYNAAVKHIIHNYIEGRLLT